MNIRDSKKSQLNRIDFQMAATHLFFIILIVFIIICIRKEAKGHVAQNPSLCYAETENNFGPKNHTRTEPAET